MHSIFPQQKQSSSFLSLSSDILSQQSGQNEAIAQQVTDLQINLPSVAAKPNNINPEADLPVEVIQANKEILTFFTERLKNTSLEDFLERFDEFFIQHDSHKIPHYLNRATYHILIFNRTTDFVYLLNRCCYLFISTCLKQKKTQYIPKLFALFEKSIELPPNAPLAPRKFRDWLLSFTHSHQYQTLKIFAPQTEQTPRTWGDRYVYFSLFAQSFNPETSIEQRQASLMLYQFLKNRYKFQLVMYLTKGCDVNPEDKTVANPTFIHPATLKLIYKLVVKKRRGYPQMAAEFLARTDKITYGTFKKMLGEHLLLAMASERRLKWLPEKLDHYLSSRYSGQNDVSVDPAFITQTCNDLIDYLLNPKNLQNPSHPFLLLMIQQEYLTVGIILLKFVLISPQSYLQLMAALSELLDYYHEQPKEDCQWLIGLFETVQVILTLVIHEGQYYSFASTA